MVRAIVVLADGDPSDELAVELQEHVRRVTAPYKYPRIVEFADELPKTPSGKIRRAELRSGRSSAGRTWREDWAGFAGIFIVTNLGLLAVGRDPRRPPPLRQGQPEWLRPRGRDRHRRLRLHRDRLPPDRRQPRRPARPQADGDRRRTPGGDRRAPLLRAGRNPGPDRRAILPRRRRGDRFHGRIGLERRHGPARAPRADDRPLWPRHLDRAHPGPADRRLLMQHAGGFNLVWAFAAGGAAARRADRHPDGRGPVKGGDRARGPFISREALGPGGTFALSVVRLRRGRLVHRPQPR